MRAETVFAAVESMETGMGLEDEIGLAGEPEAGVMEAGKHGLGGCVRRGICRLSRGAPLGWRGVRNLSQCRTRLSDYGGGPQDEPEPASTRASELDLHPHLPGAIINVN